MMRFLVLALLLSGCASTWQSRTEQALVYIHEAGVTARKIGAPVVDSICTKAAIECRDLGDQSCLPLVTCQNSRGVMEKALLGIQFAAVDIKAALAAADDVSASEAIGRAVALIAEIRGQLVTFGVLK